MSVPPSCSAGQTDVFGKAYWDVLRFEEKAVIVEAALLRDDGHVAGASILAPQPLSVGRQIDSETVARCASITRRVRTETHAPVIASVGLPFAFAEVSDLETLARACPNTASFAEADRQFSREGEQFALFLYTRLPDTPWHLRARMFAPLDNIIEDPATGSASGALGALLASLQPASDLDINITVEQGVEMGRRSLIELNVHKSDGLVRSVRMAGRCVAVMRGNVSL